MQLERIELRMIRKTFCCVNLLFFFQWRWHVGTRLIFLIYYKTKRGKPSPLPAAPHEHTCSCRFALTQVMMHPHHSRDCRIDYWVKHPLYSEISLFCRTTPNVQAHDFINYVDFTLRAVHSRACAERRIKWRTHASAIRIISVSNSLCKNPTVDGVFHLWAESATCSRKLSSSHKFMGTMIRCVSNNRNQRILRYLWMAQYRCDAIGRNKSYCHHRNRLRTSHLHEENIKFELWRSTHAMTVDIA